MTIVFAPKIEEQVRHEIESGRYPDADAVVEEALLARAERQRSRALTARELVFAGFASDDAGELIADLMDEIDRQTEERFRQGERPSRHVGP